MNTRNAPPLLHVGFSAWIVQDGNHGDFEVGQEAKFALEFTHLQELQAMPPGPVSARHLAESVYAVHARVVFSDPRVWVIDAGSFLAFAEAKPPAHATQGAFVQGEISLGIDPFFYFERLHALEGMPPLAYTWVVQAIQRETTPWLEPAYGRPFKSRDEARESFISVSRTNAWDDDGGHAEYVLACERVAGPDRP